MSLVISYGEGGMLFIDGIVGQMGILTSQIILIWSIELYFYD